MTWIDWKLLVVLTLIYQTRTHTIGSFTKSIENLFDMQNSTIIIIIKYHKEHIISKGIRYCASRIDNKQPVNYFGANNLLKIDIKRMYCHLLFYIIKFNAIENEIISCLHGSLSEHSVVNNNAHSRFSFLNILWVRSFRGNTIRMDKIQFFIEFSGNSHWSCPLFIGHTFFRVIFWLHLQLLCEIIFDICESFVCISCNREQFSFMFRSRRE